MFVRYRVSDGVVVGCQSLPVSVCRLSSGVFDGVEYAVSEISEGQFERIKSAIESGEKLEFKSGRLYVVAS